MDNNLQQENTELKARLRAFAAIIRLGRDAFSQPDLTAAGVHIVNNSRSLFVYERSSLLDMRGHSRVIAEYAQVEVKQQTEHAQALRTLCREIEVGENAIEVTAETPPPGKLSGKGRDALAYLTSAGMHLLIAPLRSPRCKLSVKEPFLWVLEYKEAVPQHVGASLTLLSADYGNALWLHVPQGGFRYFFRWMRKITFMRVFMVLLLAFFVAMFTVHVEHTVSAEFVVKPQSMFSSYAWFDSVVKSCFFNDGDKVKKGDAILEYNTDRMRFQLASAEASFKETDAEYEQESKASFTEKERLGRLKILAHKREQAQVAIAEAKWYLSHSVVRAPVSGILALTDGSADKLAGRALRIGERQFDIFFRHRNDCGDHGQRERRLRAGRQAAHHVVSPYPSGTADSREDHLFALLSRTDRAEYLQLQSQGGDGK